MDFFPTLYFSYVSLVFFNIVLRKLGLFRKLGQKIHFPNYTTEFIFEFSLWMPSQIHVFDHSFSLQYWYVCLWRQNTFELGEIIAKNDCIVFYGFSRFLLFYRVPQGNLSWKLCAFTTCNSILCA
jgi:hypothetical protein